ncbi:jg8285, partial [Pararge aegeria aegeria]
AKAEVPSPEPSVEDELLGESPAAEVHISKVERPPSVDSQPENEDTGEEEELVPEPMVSTRENSEYALITRVNMKFDFDCKALNFGSLGRNKTEKKYMA